jgi:pimeloyl-ACP methyl ester carboxylesterase
MDALAANIVGNLLLEVKARDPAYWARYPLSLPEAAMAGFEAGEGAGLRRLCLDLGVPLRDQPVSDSPLGDLIAGGLRDARVAGSQLPPLRAWTDAPAPLEYCLRHDFDERTTPAGVRYWVGRRGSQPLVIVNALGIPLAPWAALIRDASHPFRLYLVDAQCSDLLRGGMRQAGSLADESRRITQVVARERLEGALLVGWSNAARVALHAAAASPASYAGVVLLSPSLRGAASNGSARTAFETQLQKVFQSVLARPESAARFSTLLLAGIQLPDWERFRDPRAREQALLRLPALRTSNGLGAPFQNGADLESYARRATADETVDGASVLRDVPHPLLLITGELDQLVSNEHTRDVFRAADKVHVEARIRGAGHYAQDLQYQHFRHLLETFADAPAAMRPCPLRSLDA